MRFGPIRESLGIARGLVPKPPKLSAGREERPDDDERDRDHLHNGGREPRPTKVGEINWSIPGPDRTSVLPGQTHSFGIILPEDGGRVETLVATDELTRASHCPWGYPHVRAHELRHSWVTHLRAAGVDPADLAAASGHSVETATKRYVHALHGVTRVCETRSGERRGRIAVAFGRSSHHSGGSLRLPQAEGRGFEARRPLHPSCSLAGQSGPA